MTWLEELQEFFHPQHVAVLQKLEARVAVTEDETKSLAERVVALEMAAKLKPAKEWLGKEPRPAQTTGASASEQSARAEGEEKAHDSRG